MKNLFYFYVIFAVALAAHSQVIWTTTITNFFSLAGDSVNFTASGRNMATTNSPVTLAVALDCGIIYTSTPSAGNGTAWSLTGTMQWDGTNLNFSAQFDCGDPANPQVAQFGTLTNFIVGTNTFTLTIYGNTNGLTLNTASLDAFRAPQPTPPPIQGATIIIGGVSKYTSGGSSPVTNATLTQLNTASNAIVGWVNDQQFLTNASTTILTNVSGSFVLVNPVAAITNIVMIGDSGTTNALYNASGLVNISIQYTNGIMAFPCWSNLNSRVEYDPISRAASNNLNSSFYGAPSLNFYSTNGTFKAALGIRNDGYVYFASSVSQYFIQPSGSLFLGGNIVYQNSGTTVFVNNGSSGLNFPGAGNNFNFLNTTNLSSPTRTVTNSTDSTGGLGAGLMRWDTNYVYISVGTNLWKRAALATW